MNNVHVTEPTKETNEELIEIAYQARLLANSTQADSAGILYALGMAIEGARLSGASGSQIAGALSDELVFRELAPHVIDGLAGLGINFKSL